MILVDTSVWLDHLRARNRTLISLLRAEQVLTHPFVIGELACGALRNREDILRHLTALPRATAAGHDEVLSFVERRGLFGRGIEWIDAHLLASAVLTHVQLITLDRRLSRVAESVGVSG